MLNGCSIWFLDHGRPIVAQVYSFISKVVKVPDGTMSNKPYSAFME